MHRNAAPLLVALALAGCRTAAPGTSAPASDTAASPTDANAPASGEAPSVSESQPTDRGAARIADVKLQDGPAYTLALRPSSEKKQKPVAKGTYWVSWVGTTTAGPRLVLGKTPGNENAPLASTLVDDSGRQLAKFRGFRAIHEALGVAHIDEKSGVEAVLRLDTGAITRPSPQLPDGETAAKTIILGPQGPEPLWVVTQTKSGRVFAGQWSNMSVATVPVGMELPFFPRCMETMPGGVEIGAGPDAMPRPEGHCTGDGLVAVAAGSAVSKDCGRVRLGTDGTVSCRAVSGPEEGSAIFLDNWAVSVFETNITLVVDPHGEPQTPRSTQALAVDPAREKILFRTTEGFALWSPNTTVDWSYSEGDDDDFHASNAILTLASVINPAKGWIDLDRDTLYRYGDSMYPLYGFEGLQRTFFAKTGDDNHARLLEVDLDAATVREVARYDDCPREDLQLAARHGKRLAIHCERRNSETDMRTTLQWSEILDIDEGWRTRTEGWVESIALDDGRVLLSDRRHNHHAAKNPRLQSMQ